MSIAREPGPVRGSAGRARTVGWFAALALIVTAVLASIARLATGPTRAPEVSPHASAAAATGRDSDRVTIAAGSLRQTVKPAAPVADVRIVERPVPVRRALSHRPVPVSKREIAVAHPRPLPASTLPVPVKKAAPVAVALPKPAPARPVSPAAAATSGEREGERLDSPLEPEERPEAHYPEDAAAEGVTGKVRLKVVVDPHGKVEDALVTRSSGDGRLDRAAEEAVRRWRYRAALRGGRTVTATDYVEVEFYREREEVPAD
jgi:periplasmic protein TonB